MSKLSRSPERNTFQVNGYIERCREEGKEPNPAYLQMYKDALQHDLEFEQDQSQHENNLEYDLRTTEWILAKARASDVYAQNIYAALCNMQWQKREVFPILADQTCSYSWRYAGGIVADMLGKGDYIDWYCSGIRNDDDEEDARSGYASEGHVTEEIEQDFYQLGWIPVPYKDDE